MKHEIRIFPIDGVKEHWRATMKVPHKWASLPGVDGQCSEDGPWIGGEGASPAYALEALTYAIGRATLGALHWEAMAADEAPS